MKKYGICLLLALCLLLTACGARQERPAQEEPQTAAYWIGGDAEEWKLDSRTVCWEDNGFCLTKDGDADYRAPLVTEHFSGTLPDGQQERTVDFYWCVYQETVYVQQPEEVDARIVVEPIPGCTMAVTVLLLNGEGLDHGHYALARLESSTLEWLFPEQLQELEIRQLEMTPDLSGAVFLKRVPEGDGYYELPFYCDGRQLVDLEQSCGLALHTEGAVGVRWAGEDILLALSSSWLQEGARMDVYCYHTDSGLWEQTLEDVPLYVQEEQEDGVRFYPGSRYATRQLEGVLCVIDLSSGAVRDTGLPAGAAYTVHSRGGALLITAQPDRPANAA